MKETGGFRYTPLPMPRRNVVNPVARALRPHVPHSRDAAAAILTAAVQRRAHYVVGGRKKARGKIRVSERHKTARIVTPRNATLSWSRLFGEAAQAVLLVTTVPMSMPYLGLAGLVIVNQLRTLMTKELDERHGAVIYIMWKRGGEHTSQRVELVLPDVNRELRRLGKPRMSMRELRDKMDQLTELECLMPTPHGWHLKRKVWLTT